MIIKIRLEEKKFHQVMALLGLRKISYENKYVLLIKEKKIKNE